MMRPSAKRTILLTTALKETEQKYKRKKVSKHQNVNPIYMWMVQPREETGLKKGRFTLARSSQKTFTLDRENLRRSSSLWTESSSLGNLSRTSSMCTSTSFLSRTDSVSTRTDSLCEGEPDRG